MGWAKLGVPRGPVRSLSSVKLASQCLVSGISARVGVSGLLDEAQACHVGEPRPLPVLQGQTACVSPPVCSFQPQHLGVL